MTDINERRRNQALIDARARIHWGDPPEEGIKILMGQGVPYPEAAALVGEMVQERLTTLRSIGIRKTVMGAGLIAVPIVAWFGFVAAGVIPIKIFALTVMAGAWGLWMFLRGLFMLLSPKTESGDVADHNA